MMNVDVYKMADASQKHSYMGIHLNLVSFEPEV
jgi:hypothetical protein